ncbi:hypothetical protein E4U21_004065 [Claviceps maximensis]|nr:hypothetical protein E4U21_004065 [Claviceps maximensis]
MGLVPLCQTSVPAFQNIGGLSRSFAALAKPPGTTIASASIVWSRGSLQLSCNCDQHRSKAINSHGKRVQFATFTSRASTNVTNIWPQSALLSLYGPRAPSALLAMSSSSITKESPTQHQTPETTKKSPNNNNNYKPAIPPVPLLDTPLSKSLAILRPILLLALLVARFNELVSDPVSALQYALPLVAGLQIAYVVVCLPVAGFQTSKKVRPGDNSRKRAVGGNAVSTALLALLLSAMVTPAIHIIFILFGAPFLTHTAHTLLCAAHFSLLALLPIFYTRGSDGQAWVAVVSASAPLDETFGALAGAVLGAWLGAVPIPLDWDREWQKWPVTILAGLYAGSLLGSAVSGRLFYGKGFGSAREEEE